MTSYAVQDIQIEVPVEEAFEYIAEPSRLPEWTNAFASVEGNVAVLRTPRGEIQIGLEVAAEPARGTVDWRLLFPDGSVSEAYSRMVRADRGSSVYSFVLLQADNGLEQWTLPRRGQTVRERLC